MTDLLKFSFHNQKLNKLAHHLHYTYNKVISFDLPAGWSCPCADICKTRADRDTGRIKRDGRFMCYAAKAEAYAPSARRLRWHNFDLLRATGGIVWKMEYLIGESLPIDTRILRIHSSGDFFNKNYFMAWTRVAKNFPGIIFFAYTKNIELARAPHPFNLFVQYSYGSKHDKYWTPDVPTCFVAEHPGQYPYPVVCDTDENYSEDFHAILRRETFQINLH